MDRECQKDVTVTRVSWQLVRKEERLRREL